MIVNRDTGDESGPPEMSNDRRLLIAIASVIVALIKNLSETPDSELRNGYARFAELVAMIPLVVDEAFSTNYADIPEVLWGDWVCARMVETAAKIAEEEMGGA